MEMKIDAGGQQLVSISWAEKAKGQEFFQFHLARPMAAASRSYSMIGSLILAIAYQMNNLSAWYETVKV